MTRPIVLLAACALVAQAQPPAVDVPWDRIPEVLAGKHVVVALDGGSVIEGSWTGVTDDAFTFVVTRASGKARRLSGAQSISRSALRKIQFREKRVRGRVIGVIAGFYGMAAIAMAATRSREAMQGPWGLAAIAGGAGGYQLGKSIDKSLRELTPGP